MSNKQQQPKVDVSFVWNILDNVLHLTFMKNELGDVMLPFVVIRRMDCILAPGAQKVRDTFNQFKDKVNPDKLDPILRKAAGGRAFYNVSNYTMEELLNDSKNIDINFRSYLNGFNAEVRDILDNYQFDKVLARLIRNKLLFAMIQEITALDLSEDKYDNHMMGYVFEEIIRIANEENNQTAGEHFTPRDMIELMSALLFTPDSDELKQSGIIRTIYDPTCGTGGMVNLGKKYILNKICDSDGPKPTIITYGQELNEQSYAIAKSEALITGENADNIALGNTITDDRFPSKRFHYIMANPPYGVTWKSMSEYVINESLNPDGRFSAGTPRSSDGQLLFIQHMLSKMEDDGSRIGIVTNGSPLFSGGAGSGESNIRKWIIENDWLEALVALPKDMFYNTGIYTYIWILTNKKTPERQNKIQLINAVDFCRPAKKSLGSKRNDILPEHIAQICDIYMSFKEGEYCKIFKNEDFGFYQFTIEQPLRDENGKVKKRAGKPIPDASKRDTEKVSVDTNWSEYFAKEVLPHIDPESWTDLSKTKIGYEINFTRCFYKFEALEPADVIADRLNKRMFGDPEYPEKKSIVELYKSLFD